MIKSYYWSLNSKTEPVCWFAKGVSYLRIKAMARLSNITYFAFLLHISLVSSPICCIKRLIHQPNYKASSSKHVPLFVFGDSLLDAGNNNYIKSSTLERANFWPYGESYFDQPTGRFSDGRTMADFIAEYSNLPLLPPYLQPGLEDYYNGVNFASGGAGNLDETFDEDHVLSFKTQISHFRKVVQWFINKFGNDEGKKAISNAVYLFSCGANDYLSPIFPFQKHLPYSDSEYQQLVLGNLTQHIKEIYNLGARKFAFMNLPMMGCLPAMRIYKPETNGSCYNDMSSKTRIHNQALSTILFELSNNLNGFHYSLFDLTGTMEKVMNDPERYGFKDGKWGCCGGGRFRGIYSCGQDENFELCESPEDYMFWDSFHPTQHAHHHFADIMWNGSSSVISAVGPYTVKQLFQIEVADNTNPIDHIQQLMASA
ncbi:hypothetical protein K2173_024415 [Erythroxylum novogranatense]|uniref:Uncharacterized protein n=1 Tax=Erythroxylum novogranatense TaxID=1862640 RepID=A0AAV8SV04_9ROSI|nr:hypothetical protein K2173_024415 [Erythroxylum novogranatense]